MAARPDIRLTMLNIKLTTCAPNWNWARQTPKGQLEWGPFRFHVDQPVEQCDAWVVFESLSAPDETVCPPENVVFISGEPDSVGSYKPAFLQQFSHVISGRNDLLHEGQIRFQQGHPWFVEKNFDELVAMQPFAKQRDICVISSDKVFTDGHRARLEFVDKLKARFGDRVDVWGRGIRDFDSKWDLLSPYRFAIVLENYAGPDWLTEKLPDALLAYCYPIYHGCSNIERYLPDNACLRIDIEDPETALRDIERLLNTPDDYENRLADIAAARLYYLHSLQFFANISTRLQTLMVDAPAEKIVLKPNGDFPAVVEQEAPVEMNAMSGGVLGKMYARFLGHGIRQREAMAGRSIISGLKRLISRSAQLVVAQGLRPEAADLLGISRHGLADDRSQRAAAEWILRHAVAPGAADLLTSPESREERLAKKPGAAAIEWARWVARDCVASDMNGALQMPLVDGINSDNVTAPFLAGENIQVMQGSIITPDSQIGGNTYIGFNCHVTKAQIGRYVSIADSVLVGPGEHFLDQVSTSSLFYEEPYAKLTRADCTIHHDVWIGASCVIRRGVTIGTGAVIGANSFVNHDVEPFSIMAGSPARFIGYRFPEDNIKMLLESRWWELPASEARQRIEALTSELKLPS